MTTIERLTRRAEAKAVRRMRKHSRRSWVRSFSGKQRKVAQTLDHLRPSLKD